MSGLWNKNMEATLKEETRGQPSPRLPVLLTSPRNAPLNLLLLLLFHLIFHPRTSHLDLPFSLTRAKNRKDPHRREEHPILVRSSCIPSRQPHNFLS